MSLEIFLENYFFKNRNMIWKHISRGPQRKQPTFLACFFIEPFISKEHFSFLF